MSKLRKSVLIGGLAVVLSTVGIQASDVLRGVDGNVAALVGTSQNGPCDEGSDLMLLGGRSLCVDTYEVSATESCRLLIRKARKRPQLNVGDGTCQAESVAGQLPWRFVTFTQAQQLCARTGKRLPTNEEWYKAVSGIVGVNDCVIDNGTELPERTELQIVYLHLVLTTWSAMFGNG